MLNSSSISWAAYNMANKALHIRYIGNDAMYEYEKVPARKWKALREAASRGQYINLHIKPFHKNECS